MSSKFNSNMRSDVIAVSSNYPTAKEEKQGRTLCTGDYLPYLGEKQVYTGVCTPCANARQVDEAKFFPNMAMDVGSQLIDPAAEASVFNF